MNKDPLDKVDSLKNMLVWTQVLLITVAICIPGIIISSQYYSDECVRKSAINVALDQWLLAASICHMVVIISFLPVVCCVWKHKCVRLIPLVFVLVLFVWGGIGVYLMVESDLSNCSHDSLWIMSLIEIIFGFGFILIYTAIQLNSCVSCPNRNERCCGNCCGNCRFFRSRSYLDEDEDEDVEKIRWLLSNNFDTFKVNSSQ